MKRKKIVSTLLISAALALMLVSCKENISPVEKRGTENDPQQTSESTVEQSGKVSDGSEKTEESAKEVLGEAEASITVEDMINQEIENQPVMEINGTRYRLRESVSAYLIMGIDKSGEAGKQDIESDNGRNDANLLVVVDHAKKAYTTLQLNRDTMVPIDAITYYGDYMDTFEMPLCMAHFYGDGAGISCENVIKSVRYLLGEIPINGYIALQYDGIGAVNDAVGGVTVTITDDFSKVDSTLKMGETVLLKGEQAHHYVRSRMSVGDGLNTSREERQRIYTDAFAAKCRQKIKESSSVINGVYDAAKPYMVTNMSLGSITNLAASCLDYTDDGFLTLPESFSIPKEGEAWSGYVTGRVDTDKLTEMVINLFYQEL